MKLTKILYSIILCLTIEHGRYYALAGNGEADAGAQPPKTPGAGATTPIAGAGATTPGQGAGATTPIAGAGATTPGQGAGAGGSSDEQVKKDKKIIKEGCNFYDGLDLGVKAFSEIKKDQTVCRIKLNEEADAFLYACDGTSDPPNCPKDVKTDEGVKKIEDFFTQATVTDESGSFPTKPKLFHVITGKAHKTFSASCVCTKQNGTKETMELTSSFKQAGIVGILGFILVYLMK